MSIWRWILALVYALLFTYGLVAVLQPGDNIVLGAIAGTVLSLVLAYAPGVAAEFNKLLPEYQQAVNIVLMVLVSAMIFGLTCASLLFLYITCDTAGALELLKLIITGLVVGQGVYKTNDYIAEKFRARVY